MKGQGLNLSTIAFLVLLLASACTPVPTPAPTPTPVPPTPTPGPVDLVMAFQDSLNRGAIDDAAAMFHDDKVGIHIPGIMPGNIGISQLLGDRDTLEYWAAMGLTLDLSGCNLEDNEVNCQMLARDEACSHRLPGSSVEADETAHRPDEAPGVERAGVDRPPSEADLDRPRAIVHGGVDGLRGGAGLDAQEVVAGRRDQPVVERLGRLLRLVFTRQHFARTRHHGAPDPLPRA